MATSTPATSPDSLAIVLAAGAGTRMKSSIPKVMHPILGKPLLGWVLDALAGAGWNRTRVVAGHGRAQVIEYLSAEHDGATWVVQEEQLGTAHAVECALAGVPAEPGLVLVMAGDMPLITSATLDAFRAAHVESGAAATVLTARVPDPTGYGRVIRDERGRVRAIVEHRDADPGQLAVDEINTSTYLFDATLLREALDSIGTGNSQGEQYLTDAVEILTSRGLEVGAFVVADPDEVHGINDRVQMSRATRLLTTRLNEEHQRAGVTLLDPATTWIEPGVEIESDVVIERNSQLSRGTVIETGATIGPDTTLIACKVGSGACVVRSHCIEAEIGPGSSVGPFTYLRPGSVLGANAKTGAFVEMKNSTLGVGSKVPHLSYVGDATIGDGTNIGASTVVVNYDGVDKHHTVIGDQVRIGSDSMLIAPVEVGDGAYTAAGSVITDDVPPGAIGVGRARQVNVESWVLRKRADTASARAAEAALAAAADLPPADPPLAEQER